MKYKTGRVYFLKNCPVSFPVKDKLAICVSGKNLLFILINSVDERRPYQHELEHVVYFEAHQINCLSHKSYTNVSKLQLIQEDQLVLSEERETLSNAVWLNIRSKINQDPTIPQKYKTIVEKETKS